MKLFKLTQKEAKGYDTYDSCVVAAEDEAAAKATHPDPGYSWEPRPWGRTWALKPSKVKAEYLGEAREGMPAGVICASFNAG